MHAEGLALLKVGRAALVEREPSKDDWYVNLLWIERRKCLLMIHAGTLFSVFIPDVRAGEMRPFGPYLTGHVECELRREGLPAETFWPFGPLAAVLAKTADRSVVGCMNDMSLFCEQAVVQDAGLRNCDIATINRRLRRHIVGVREFTYPIDATRALVDGKSAP